jgi:hypothetical protein
MPPSGGIFFVAQKMGTDPIFRATSTNDFFVDFIDIRYYT